MTHDVSPPYLAPQHTSNMQTHRVGVGVNWPQEGGRIIICLQYVQKFLRLLHPQLKERSQNLEVDQN